MRQMALPQRLLADVVIDVNCLTPYISPKLLDELPRHTSSSQVSREPMSAAMLAKVVVMAASAYETTFSGIRILFANLAI
jgi:hypothetical protein